MFFREGMSSPVWRRTVQQSAGDDVVAGMLSNERNMTLVCKVPVRQLPVFALASESTAHRPNA
jgi:hypothetical protein